MRTLTFRMHPLTLCALLTLAVSGSAVARARPDKSLHPPVTISGGLSGPLLSVTSTNTKGATAIIASGTGAGTTINSTNSGSGVAGFFGNTGTGSALSLSNASSANDTIFAKNSYGAVAYFQANSTTNGSLYLTNSGDGLDVNTSGGTGVNAVTGASNKVALYGVATAQGGGALGGTAANGLGLDVTSGGDQYNNVVFVGDLSNNALMLLDSSGNLTIKGKLTQHGTASRSHPLPAGDNATFEHVGNATLLAGAAAVTFGNETRAALAGKSYAVFLTPLGDAHTLFVAQKSTAGFTVRESEGGRSSTRFDYRVVAY